MFRVVLVLVFLYNTLETCVLCVFWVLFPLNYFFSLRFDIYLVLFDNEKDFSGKGFVVSIYLIHVFYEQFRTVSTTHLWPIL